MIMCYRIANIPQADQTSTFIRHRGLGLARAAGTRSVNRFRRRRLRRLVDQIGNRISRSSRSSQLVG